jgi:hypothetical protein
VAAVAAFLFVTLSLGALAFLDFGRYECLDVCIIGDDDDDDDDDS